MRRRHLLPPLHSMSAPSRMRAWPQEHKRHSLLKSHEAIPRTSPGVDGRWLGITLAAVPLVSYRGRKIQR
jgi:hypothetical protein